MRSLSLVQVFIFTNILFSLLAITCHSAELNPNTNGYSLKWCSEHARMVTDLNDASRKIEKTRANEDKLIKINKIVKELEERLESTCPGIGFECKTFLSRPEKNVCKPFKIQTNDRLVLKNNTYQ